MPQVYTSIENFYTIADQKTIIDSLVSAVISLKVSLSETKTALSLANTRVETCEKQTVLRDEMVKEVQKELVRVDKKLNIQKPLKWLFLGIGFGGAVLLLR